jgi:hypothetical protein
MNINHIFGKKSVQLMGKQLAGLSEVKPQLL